MYFSNVIHGQVEVLQFFESIHVLCKSNDIRLLIFVTPRRRGDVSSGGTI